MVVTIVGKGDEGMPEVPEKMVVQLHSKIKDIGQYGFLQEGSPHSQGNDLSPTKAPRSPSRPPPPPGTAFASEAYMILYRLLPYMDV